MTDQMTSKERILRAARKLFGAYGYTETTIKKVSEEAGVAFGLIPHYYGSKEKLFVSASLSVMDEIMERIHSGTGDSPDGLVAAMRFVERYLSCAVDADMHFTILVRCSPYSDIKLDINKEDIINRFEELVNELASRISRGVEDGSVVPCDPKRTAVTVFASIVGSVRTQLSAPYCPDNFFKDVLAFVYRSLKNTGECYAYEPQMDMELLTPRR